MPSPELLASRPGGSGDPSSGATGVPDFWAESQFAQRVQMVRSAGERGYQIFDAASNRTCPSREALEAAAQALISIRTASTLREELHVPYQNDQQAPTASLRDGQSDAMRY